MSALTRRAFCWIVVVINLFALEGKARAQEAAWRQTIVHLKCKDSSFEQALEQVATQANISLVADGVPLPKPFTLEADLPAEKALTQIAEAFDCSWNVSKSGIALLRKRFTNEHERPQVVPAEMRAALHDLMGFVKSEYTPRPGKSLSDSFWELEAKLPPEALKQFHTEKGLRISALPPALQQQAIGIILQNQLETAALNFDRLDKQLAALPEASVHLEDIPFFGGKPHPYVVLNFNPASRLQHDLLYEKNGADLAKPPPDFDALRFERPQLETIAQAQALLEHKYHLKLTLSPDSGERRIVLKLQDADAPLLPSALAELYDWMLQQPDSNTFYLLRRQVSMPQSMAEWGKAILQALPTDISRCWSTRPMTLHDKPYTDPHKLLPELPHPENFTKGLIGSKSFVQQEDSLRYLLQSAQNETFAPPRPYSKLSSELQRELVYHLYYFMLSQCQGDLLDFMYPLPSWIADPLNARLSLSGGGFRIIGSGGGMVMIAAGPPVKAN